MKRNVYLYAPLGDDYSYATVAKAWISYLRDRYESRFNVIPVDIFNSQQFDIPSGDVASEELGIAWGPYSLCEQVLGKHRRKILQLVPDTTLVPSYWADFAMACNIVVTPSTFGREALVDSGVKKSKIKVIQHGADPDVFKPVHDAVQHGFLHATTSTMFWERKGTVQLLRAWKSVEPSLLTVLLPPKTRLPDHLVRPYRLAVEIAPSRTPERFARYLSTFEAVVCPSRGEGFGMIPVQARLCGVVPILTSCTGHAEHFDADTDVLVEHGEPAACWGPGLAPKVSVYCIEEAVLNYLQVHEEKRRNLLARRAELAKRWAWREVLKPMGDVVQELA